MIRPRLFAALALAFLLVLVASAYFFRYERLSSARYGGVGRVWFFRDRWTQRICVGAPGLWDCSATARDVARSAEMSVAPRPRGLTEAQIEKLLNP